MSKTIQVIMAVPVPDDATEEQIKEWLYYNVGHRSEMTIKNPLCDLDMEAAEVSFRVEVR